ncbi:MAG: type III-A CRISPR-associated RAMP protein Csm5 [Bacteroidales bacterium]|nr:type III-A CRISPR-associated RAMP protein Csm5 [Bacteroidales bacterium]
MENRQATTERKHIKIQTLTPVHIGSGEVLQKGFEYLEKKDKNGSYYVHVLNQKELFKELLDKGITIEKLTSELAKNGSIEGYVKTNLKDVPIDYYSQRYILLVNQKSGANELRSHIHDGFGNPIIPGSSIKGAIHTAILSAVKGKEKDLLKFLKISDASFEQEGMDALNMTLLNIRQSNSFDDTSKKQLVEAITSGEESDFVIKISDTSAFPYHSIEELFKQINSTTERILQSEIDFWEKEDNWNEFDNEGDYKLVYSYLRKCKEIRKKITSDKHSCVLRIGNSNGWRFITGCTKPPTASELLKYRKKDMINTYSFQNLVE